MPPASTPQRKLPQEFSSYFFPLNPCQLFPYMQLVEFTRTPPKTWLFYNYLKLLMFHVKHSRTPKENSQGSFLWTSATSLEIFKLSEIISVSRETWLFYNYLKLLMFHVKHFCMQTPMRVFSNNSS
jgi:hypothetical protein